MAAPVLLFAASSALSFRRSQRPLRCARCAAVPGWRGAASAAGSGTADAAGATAPFDTERFFRTLQAAQVRLCGELAAADGGGAAFSADAWTRPGPSRGEARVLQSGAVLEKAGVNTSLMRGVLAPARAQAMRARGRDVEDGAPFSAAALSFVLHFHSPFLPTLRGDVRVFALDNGEFWGGGGVDLTPFYLGADMRALVSDWHRHWRAVCDEFDTAYYPAFKQACDDYFYLPMREQWRGVGGLFFDDFQLEEGELTRFLYALLDNVTASYAPILAANRDAPYTAEQKRFQRLRRAIYLEFNLTTDRGVRAGLGADAARTEAIMISAPPSCDWEYGWRPEAGSAEAEAVDILSSPPRAWC